MYMPLLESRVLVAIPVFNEAKYVSRVLSRVREFARDVLVIDDGSTDETPMLLARQPVEVIRHSTNRGYGRSLQDMFRWAVADDFEWLITMDCDEQHEPEAIPDFLHAIRHAGVDVISGSRYLVPQVGDDSPPPDRRTINATITDELNRRLGLSLTDSFCGFKAYRLDAIRRLTLDVDGYDFPMQFWVQAVAHNLRMVEIPVRLIYNDPTRTFGGPLDDASRRLMHYRRTMHNEIVRCASMLPPSALAGLRREDAHACRCGA